MAKRDPSILNYNSELIYNLVLLPLSGTMYEDMKNTEISFGNLETLFKLKLAKLFNITDVDDYSLMDMAAKIKKERGKVRFQDYVCKLINGYTETGRCYEELASFRRNTGHEAKFEKYKAQLRELLKLIIS